MVCNNLLLLLEFLLGLIVTFSMYSITFLNAGLQQYLDLSISAVLLLIYYNCLLEGLKPL